MCKKRRHTDICYSETLLTVHSVCMQKPWHIILQFTFFFSSKIFYLCKIGTYNTDSHLISLRLNLKRKVSTRSVSSIRRQSRKYPQKSNPNQIKPHPNVYKHVCDFKGFLSYHMAKVWSSYQTEDLYCIMYRNRGMVSNDTLNNISIISRQSAPLLAGETGVPGENHWRNV